jgi:glycine/D-amino acid oxidase-like deaminating enzyme
MKTSQVDVLVIGGGPAGLAAAIELKKSGVNTVRVLERERVAGGVPRHSFHPGYGLRDFKQFLSGPRYAKKYVDEAVAAGVVISTLCTATQLEDKNSVQVTSPAGLETISARAIILATGARERARAARAVPLCAPVPLLRAQSGRLRCCRVCACVCVCVFVCAWTCPGAIECSVSLMRASCVLTLPIVTDA